MTVVPLPPRGQWFGDARDAGRALRVSWHAGPGASDCVVLSTWRDDTCVASTRLSPVDAARLIGVLADGLAATGSANASTTISTTISNPASVSAHPGDVESA